LRTLPLMTAIASVSWLTMSDIWSGLAASAFGGSLLVVVILLPRSRRRRHHLTGSVLKLGTLAGLAQLWTLTLAGVSRPVREHRRRCRKVCGAMAF